MDLAFILKIDPNKARASLNLGGACLKLYIAPPAIATNQWTDRVELTWSPSKHPRRYPESILIMPV